MRNSKSRKQARTTDHAAKRIARGCLQRRDDLAWKRDIRTYQTREA